MVELALKRETKDSLREASMDDRLIDGRGGTMPFSLERMDAWKRKPRSGKRPGSPAPAQARRTRRAAAKAEGERMRDESEQTCQPTSPRVRCRSGFAGRSRAWKPAERQMRNGFRIPYQSAIEGSEFGRKAAAQRVVSEGCERMKVEG